MLVMIRKAISGHDRISLIRGMLFLYGLLVCYNASAQHEQKLPSKYIEINVGAQSHFGQYENQAKISGGIDTLFFDSIRHYWPGFKGTIPVEVAFGFWGPGRFRLEGRLGYFNQDIGLVKTLGSEEFHLANSGTLLFNLSALLYLGNKPEKIPYGFYCGFSAGCLYPLKFTLDKQAKDLFGIDRIVPAAEFHFGMEASWSARIPETGLYFTAKLATDLPLPLMGSLGHFRMAEGAAYSVNDHGIKMYSFRISGGIGYMF